jgi:hypothetical protein
MGLSSEIVWLKVVSFDMSLLKGEAPKYSADFNHPLLYERPFKFSRHLVGPLGTDSIIAVSAIIIHSAIFKLKQHGNGHGNGNEHGNRNRHGNGNGHGNKNEHGNGNGHGNGNRN